MMVFADWSNKRRQRYKHAFNSRPPSAAAPCFFLAAGGQVVVCAWGVGGRVGERERGREGERERGREGEREGEFFGHDTP
jgi:hypothetical protein